MAPSRVKKQASKPALRGQKSKTNLSSAAVTQLEDAMQANTLSGEGNRDGQPSVPDEASTSIQPAKTPTRGRGRPRKEAAASSPRTPRSRATKKADLATAAPVATGEANNNGPILTTGDQNNSSLTAARVSFPKPKMSNVLQLGSNPFYFQNPDEQHPEDVEMGGGTRDERGVQQHEDTIDPALRAMDKSTSAPGHASGSDTSDKVTPNQRRRVVQDDDDEDMDMGVRSHQSEEEDAELDLTLPRYDLNLLATPNKDCSVELVIHDQWNKGDIDLLEEAKILFARLYIRNFDYKSQELLDAVVVHVYGDRMAGDDLAPELAEIKA